MLLYPGAQHQFLITLGPGSAFQALGEEEEEEGSQELRPDCDAEGRGVVIFLHQTITPLPI